MHLPAIGQVEAEFLTDGHPIFVVHHRDERISVLDGFSSFAPFGISTLLWWCPEGRLFSDPAYGAAFDEWGLHRFGPAPTSLTVLGWEPLTPVAIHVTGPIGVAGPRANTGHEPVDWARCHYVKHHFDHGRALTPGRAAAEPAGRWVLVTGMLDLFGSRLCGIGAGCPSPVSIEHLLVYPTDPPNAWRAVTFWVALTAGGALDHLTVAPLENQ